MSGQEVNFFNWWSGEPNGEIINENCIHVLDSKYIDISCDLYPACFPCKIHEDKIFRLKGFCTSRTRLDTDYYLPADMLADGKIGFRGLLGYSYIILNRDTSVWDLKLTDGKLPIAILKDITAFPIGLKTWSFLNSSICSESLNFEQIQLKFTKVTLTKFLILIDRVIMLE